MFADPPRPSQIIAEALQSGELSIDDVTPTRESIDDVDINISSSIDVLTGSMKELRMLLPIPPTQQLHRNNNIEDNNNDNNDKEDVSADVSRHDDEEDEDEDEDEKDGIEKRKGRDVSRCLCYHHHRSYH